MKLDKKYYCIKNRWLFLILLLPVSFIIWYIVETISILSGIWSVCWFDETNNTIHCNWEWTLMYSIIDIARDVLSIIVNIWVVWFIPWIVMFIIGRKKLKKIKTSN